MQAVARIELLQRMPIFGGIRDDALEFIVERTGSVGVTAGGYLLPRGGACAQHVRAGVGSRLGAEELARQGAAGACSWGTAIASARWP